MKAQTKSYWFISMLVILGITIIIFLKEFQLITSTILSLIAKTSSDVVSSQLSNLITTSGAAPYEVEITYIPSKSALYDVSITSRELTVKSKSRAAYLLKLPSTHPFATNVSNAEYTDVNTFKIEKKVVKGGIAYEFFAQKT